MAQWLLLALSCSTAVGSFHSNLHSDAPKIIQYMEGDVIALVGVLEEWLSGVVHQPVEFNTHFFTDAHRPQRLGACDTGEAEGCYDLVKMQAANDYKGLSQYLVQLFSLPPSEAVKGIPARAEHFGFWPSSAAAQCLAKVGKKQPGAGGGSGAGFQIYCDGRLLIDAGGGGGGGIDVSAYGRASYEGGGGGGASLEDNRRGVGGGGGGDGIVGGKESGFQPETEILGDDRGTSLIDREEVRQCFYEHKLSIQGGGGGGGGIGDDSNGCGLGYGFKFSYGPPPPEDEENEEDEQKKEKDSTESQGQAGSPFQAGADKCGGFTDWSCVCEETKKLSTEAWVKQLTCSHSGGDTKLVQTSDAALPMLATTPRLLGTPAAGAAAAVAAAVPLLAGVFAAARGLQRARQARPGSYAGLDDTLTTA